MRRTLAACWHGIWLNRRQQSLLIITLSLITCLWIWLEGGRVLDVESLQTLWRSGHPPQALIARITRILVPLSEVPELAHLAATIHHEITTALAPTLFARLLAPFADSPNLAVAIMAILSTLSLWLYCRLSRLIGIGPQTTFLLFLLLNFNPEYNDVRLQISRFQPVLILWLAGLYLFLAHYKNHIHLAFTAWAATAWTAALFVPIAAFWARASRCCSSSGRAAATGAAACANAAASSSPTTPSSPLLSPAFPNGITPPAAGCRKSCTKSTSSETNSPSSSTPTTRSNSASAKATSSRSSSSP